MNRRFVNSLLMLASLSLASCGDPTPPPAQPTREADPNVKVGIFGGVLLIGNEDGSLTFVDPKMPASHIGMQGTKPHVVRLKISTGDRVGGGAKEVALAGYAIRFGGLAQSADKTVDIPDASPTRNFSSGPCQKTEATAGSLPIDALHDLRALHPESTLTLTDETVNFRIDVDGGRLRLPVADRCWALENAAARNLASQPMVYGDQALVFESTLIASNLTIELVPLAANTVSHQTIEVSPQAGSGRVEVEVFHDGGNIPVKMGEKMKGFDRMYGVVGGVPADEQYSPVAQDAPPAAPKGGYTPGKECGSARYWLRR